MEGSSAPPGCSRPCVPAVVQLLVCLKVRHPDRITILRGNHREPAGEGRVSPASVSKKQRASASSCEVPDALSTHCMGQSMVLQVVCFLLHHKDPWLFCCTLNRSLKCMASTMRCCGKYRERQRVENVH